MPTGDTLVAGVTTTESSTTELQGVGPFAGTAIKGETCVLRASANGAGQGAPLAVDGIQGLGGGGAPGNGVVGYGGPASPNQVGGMIPGGVGVVGAGGEPSAPGALDGGVGVSGAGGGACVDGVQGAAAGRRCAGVHGFNSVTVPPSPAGENANGVWGETSYAASSGVLGENHYLAPISKKGVFPPPGGSGPPQPPTQLACGVTGRSSGAQLTGAANVGVYGLSDHGQGVLGWGGIHGVEGFGARGYGAFLSGGLAPLFLQPSAAAGPPASGSHAAGELYVDQGVNLYFCKVSGTPGTWQKVA